MAIRGITTALDCMVEVHQEREEQLVGRVLGEASEVASRSYGGLGSATFAQLDRRQHVQRWHSLILHISNVGV